MTGGPGGGVDRRPPAERVRASLSERLAQAELDLLPTGYTRLGSVLVLDVPERLRPSFGPIGAAWQRALGVSTVLRRAGPVEGELRSPRLETIAGGPTETCVLEHGIRFRFDAARLLFARGNREERHRLGRLVRPGEVVADLFAGIGYFSLPALVTGRAGRVVAVEKNPLAFRYLIENLAANGVAGRAEALLGDNLELPRTPVAADRVVLGYLPDSVPWVPRAIEQLGPSGGTLHVHLLAGTRAGLAEPVARVRRAVEAALGTLEAIDVRVVKPYGPGRDHVVVDVRVGPPRGRSSPNGPSRAWIPPTASTRRAASSQ